MNVDVYLENLWNVDENEVLTYEILIFQLWITYVGLTISSNKMTKIMILLSTIKDHNHVFISFHKEAWLYNFYYFYNSNI